MAKKGAEFKIVGKYMSGKEVTGYHLKTSEAGKTGRYGKDEVAFLVGKGQIKDVKAQLYQDKVLFRGIGDVPTKEDKKVTKKA